LKIYEAQGDPGTSSARFKRRSRFFTVTGCSIAASSAGQCLPSGQPTQGRAQRPYREGG